MQLILYCMPNISTLPEMIGHKLPCTPDENVWAKLGYDRFHYHYFDMKERACPLLLKFPSCGTAEVLGTSI